MSWNRTRWEMSLLGHNHKIHRCNLCHHHQAMSQPTFCNLLATPSSQPPNQVLSSVKDCHPQNLSSSRLSLQLKQLLSSSRVLLFSSQL